MAWHDNHWNGKICQDPESNVYCVGTHSLLSERIAKNRRLDIETQYKEKKIDELPENYIPPCYYTLNAFSPFEQEVEHRHPFEGAKATPIKDKIMPESVFTWPFRLSFNQGTKNKKLEGSYPPNLEDRISRFIKKFEPGYSLVFFYLNYDNPISGDDKDSQGRYLLVGCAPITRIEEPKHFSLDKGWLLNIKKRDIYKNFPSINWAFQVSAATREEGVILPYNEYLEHVTIYPEEQSKLDKIKVLIDESAIIPNFKYVATDIDDDVAIYLLYKIKRSLLKASEDKISNVSDSIKRIDKLISRSWKKRGLYPSLSKVLTVLCDNDSNNVAELKKYEELVAAVKEVTNEDEDLLEHLITLLSNRIYEGELGKFSGRLNLVADSLNSLTEDELELSKKLCLFNLTAKQIHRIIYKRENAFKRQISAAEIVKNPYLLVEEYQPENLDPEDLADLEGIPDREIGLFSIDIGLNPDPDFVQANSEQLTPGPKSQERIRAITIEYLTIRGDQGDSFVTFSNLYDYITDNPLFYKSSLNITPDRLKSNSDKFGSHLAERIYIESNSKVGSPFFYLKEVKYAEELIKKTIRGLVSAEDYNYEVRNIDAFNRREAEVLSSKIENFDTSGFISERSKLLSSVFKKHFYIISGKPGSGKTRVVRKIVDELMNKSGENVLLLAPTGKATIRMKNEIDMPNAVPLTIDRFIYRTNFRPSLESFRNILNSQGAMVPPIQNLIIDESSMVDLQRFAILMGALWRDSKQKQISVKRLILVGDENQLPPIGIGRPFYDIIQMLKSEGNLRDSHYVKLRTNCRLNSDIEILRTAELFESKNRYYEERLSRILQGGQISKGLKVDLWKTNSELKLLLTDNIDRMIMKENSSGRISPENRKIGMYKILGLNDYGFVPYNLQDKKWIFGLEEFQILSPYRTGDSGTLGLNDSIKRTYNPDSGDGGMGHVFTHADKLIRINNWYEEIKGNGRDLILSNGSVGVLCKHKSEGPQSKLKGRKYYFPEFKYPRGGVDGEENFELAYAITVHKAQGSEFENVFLVIPRKKALLSKELIYTAFTRGKRSLTLFLQNNSTENPLKEAMGRSAILSRNTSIFDEPEDLKDRYWPTGNVAVKSKIEYIIFKYLEEARQAGRLDFQYEKELVLDNGSIIIHPDFTILTGSKTFYWEHLGELDLKEYSKNWEQRVELYRKNGLLENLLTTDDLEGVKEERIRILIASMESGTINGGTDKFSKHHFTLY